MINHKDILLRYLPAKAVDIVYEWIVDYNIHLRITKSRKTKLGDYQPHGPRRKFHTITINHDLNPYTFLIIFIHELAHLFVWNNFGIHALAHGKEWKFAYSELIKTAINENNLFPPDITHALEKYKKNPSATIFSDIFFTKILFRYDININKKVFIEDISFEGLFKISTGEVFRKKEKIRKKIKCTCLRNERVYLFSPSAQVLPVEQNH